MAGWNEKDRGLVFRVYNWAVTGPGRHEILSGILRYGLTAAGVAGAIALQLLLVSWAGPDLETYILFYPVVMAAALLGGFGPGLLATALLGISAAFLFLPPSGIAVASLNDRLGLATFVCMGFFMSVLADLYRRSREKASTYDREKALLETESKLLGIYGSMAEGLALYDIIYNPQGAAVDYILTEANPAFERLSGFGLALVTGKKASAFYGPGAPPYLDAFSRVASTGIPESFAAYYERTEMYFNISVFSHQKGKAAAIFQDITEHRRAEEEMQNALNRFYLVLSNMPSGILLVTEDSRVEFVNQAFCGMFGLPDAPGDLKGITSKEIIEKIRPAYKYPDNEVERVLEIVGLDQAVRDEDVIMGDDRTLLRDFVPVRLGENKFGRMWIHRDITSRKRSEQVLLQREEELREAQGIAHIGSWYWDAATDATTGSGELLRIFGFEPEFQSMPDFKDQKGVCYPDEDWERIDAAVKRTVETGIGYELDVRALRRGKPIWVTTRSVAVRDAAGGIIGLRGTVQDITLRKMAEDVLKRDKETFEKLVREQAAELTFAQKELDKSKRLSDIGMLAATVAHELRNPLGVINVASYNMRKKIKSGQVLKHLGSIDKKVEEGSRIINNLLFYARLKQPQYEKIGIFNFLNECAQQVKKAGKAKISILMDLDQVRHISMDADPTQLREVFINLLNNAADAVPVKKGKVIISGEDGGDLVKITITDNGHGISRENLAKIFDPFFTTKAKGTGLGLSVCRQIISLHDGTINIESEEGKGTAVVIMMPREAKRAEPPPSLAAFHEEVKKRAEEIYRRRAAENMAGDGFTDWLQAEAEIKRKYGM